MQPDRLSALLLALITIVAIMLPDAALAQATDAEADLVAKINGRIYVSRWLMVITCLWAAACWWVTRFAEKPMDATTGALLAATWGVLPLLCKLYLDLGAQIIHSMPPVIEASLFLVLGSLVYMIFLTAYAPDIVEREKDTRSFDVAGRRRRPGLFRFFVYLALTWPMIAVGFVINMGGGDGFAREWVTLGTLESISVLLVAFFGVVLAVLIRTNISSYQMPPLPRLMILLYGLAGALVLPAVGIRHTDLPPLLLPLATLYGTFACVLFLHGFMNFREEELWRQAQLLRSLRDEEEEDEEVDDEPTLLPHDLPLGWLFLIGVIYPALTLFFTLPRPDIHSAPYPTNVFMIFSLCPVLLAMAFAALWRPGEQNPPRWSLLLMIATLGAVAGVGGYVLLGYAPVTIIQAALGTPQNLLLPVISLIFSGVVALTLAHVVLTRSSFSHWRRPLQTTFRGFAAILLLSLILPDVTAMVQRLTLISTMRNSGQDLRLMQLVGEEQALLSAAYTGETLRERNSPRTVDWIESLFADLQPGTPRQYQVTRDQARGVFYRLTGESVSARPRPDDLMQINFDPDYASGGVGGRVPGLNLVSITAREDSPDPFADNTVSEQDIGVWRGTLSFTWENTDWVTNQVRALFHFPVGSNITRARRVDPADNSSLTALPASQYAYANPRVAVTEAPLMRLFKTSSGLVYLSIDKLPADGGRMTAELDVELPVVETEGQLAALMPRLLEQNATRPASVRLVAETGRNAQSRTPRTLYWPDDGQEMAMIPLSRRWAPSPSQDRLSEPPAAVVVDLSRELRPHAETIAAFLDKLSTDTLVVFTGDAQADRQNWPSANEYKGGKDAGASLALALKRGADTGRPVLWLTGPQPIYLTDSVAGLADVNVDLLESGTADLRVLSAGVGNNLYLFSPFLLQQISGLSITMIDRRGSYADDLARILPEGGQPVSALQIPAPAPFTIESWLVPSPNAEAGLAVLRDPSVNPLIPRFEADDQLSILQFGLAPRAAWFLLTLFLLLKAVFVIRRTWLEVVNRSRGKGASSRRSPAMA
ncbi:MAG: hypothetical protein Alpg2KO_31370 [Alphaproteobacteria bacterium]